MKRAAVWREYECLRYVNMHWTCTRIRILHMHTHMHICIVSPTRDGPKELFERQQAVSIQIQPEAR
jgi:hypothetical protein